ncbi:VOC family protein [Alkaliphilus sp. MSJ-5]|uniref:VOC family protein n=1 Tax=Alkaliphilus flagellatus TaxID=2841507 RepID=A0ABS6G134_9FIRM|nr:VOC family protein [Alkaliphilus flagellatus]MBU5675851.1 VOC family protein [Alkaliphilus flagellatus]
MSLNIGNSIMFIIYVENQEISKLFYQELLGIDPILDVPGMTEFQLSQNVTLGIMPAEGIVRVLENKIPNPQNGKGIPRCEIYLFVEDPDDFYYRLIKAGGIGISKTELRSWGHYVSYGSDIDGHIIAFAKK